MGCTSGDGGKKSQLFFAGLSTVCIGSDGVEGDKVMLFVLPDEVEGLDIDTGLFTCFGHPVWLPLAVDVAIYLVKHR